MLANADACVQIFGPVDLLTHNDHHIDGPWFCGHWGYIRRFLLRQSHLWYLVPDPGNGF